VRRIVWRRLANLPICAKGREEPEVDRMDDDLTLPKPTVDELQTALREMEQSLKQMRSQRDAARSQCEQLQRRWKQQVEQIERRLNQSQLECERLQRELDAMTRSATPAAAPPGAAPVRLDGGHAQRTMLSLGSSEVSNRPTASLPREPSLRYIFTHIRNRAPCR
jgi:TolA-binding protein